MIASQIRLTVDFDSVASRAEGLGQGGLDVSHRQAPDEAGDDEGLQGVGAAHAHAQQPGGEGLVGAPQLGALDGDRAGVVLTVVGQWPLRLPGRARSPWA